MSKTTRLRTVDLTTAHDLGDGSEVSLALNTSRFRVTRVDDDCTIRVGGPNDEPSPVDNDVYVATDGEPFGTVIIENTASTIPDAELVIEIEQGYCRERSGSSEVRVSAVTQELGSDDLVAGQETNVGAAAALNGATSLAISEVVVQADPGNAGDVSLGGDTLQTIVLEPGSSIVVPVDDVAKVFVAGSGTETVNWLARRRA